MAEIKPLQMVVYEGNADLQTAGCEDEFVALVGNGSTDAAQEDNADLQAVDGEGEFATEEVVAGCDDPATGKFMEPMKGMVFDSENDAITFSQRYAQNKGFTMIRRTSKSMDDKLQYFTLACNRQGKDQCSSRNKLTHNSSTKTQCPAKLNFRLHGPDKFCLTSLILEHNHDLSPSEIGVYMCQNKTAGLSAKRRRTESSGRSEVCANKMTIFTHAKGGGSENQQETTPSSEDQQFGENERTDNSKEEMMMYRGSADPQTSGGEDESVALPGNRSTGALQEGNADLPAVDAEGEFATEEIGAGSDPAKGRVMEPIKGMIFDSENDAVTFGQRYARNKGFAIIRRTSRAMDEKLQYFTLACNRQGKAQFCSRSSSRNKLKHNPSTKTQCPAKLNFRLHGPDKFCLTSLILEHNHDLSPSETRVSMCQNKTPVVSAKRRREPSPRSEVCANKMIIFTHAQGGGSGDQQFGENECTNNSKEETRLKFSAEDTHVLYRYFFRMQSKNPNFFYAMDFDENSQLRSHVFISYYRT